MIDQTASAVNAAKAILMSLDRARIETPVQTEHLRWLLETLVGLGTRKENTVVADSAFRSFLSADVSVANAVKERDESDRKEAESQHLARLNRRAPGVELTPDERAFLHPPDGAPATGGAREAERSRGW